MPEQALSKVKIIDLTWYITGPYCTKLLADYGADVLKVERPCEGDPARKLGPFFKDDPNPEKSGLFLYLNTNKKSTTVNLKSQWGASAIRELVKDADILVENFRPGVIERLGLGYGELEKINPRLVMTSISNFGQSGPYRDFKASEIIIYGMGGSMCDSGLPEREPLKKGTGTPILFSTGNMAALATMIALFQARKDGVGQQVDFSLMEAQAESIDRRMSQLVAFQYNGEITNRSNRRQRLVHPVGTYPCKDGWWDIAAAGVQWPAVSKMMGMPELLTDARFNTSAAQMERDNADQFLAIFLPWSLEHTKQECIDLGQKAGANCGPLNNMEEVFNDPHFRARGFWTEVEHPVTGRLTYPGRPFVTSEMPWAIRRPAPLLGEHNAEVFCNGLGYSQQDLVKLREAGYI